MSTSDGACLASGRRGGGGSTAKPSDRGTLGHTLVVALIGVVIMSAVMAPSAGGASASASSGSVSARPAPLTAASAVTLAVRLIVGDGDGPVRAEVMGPGQTALRAMVRGSRAPGGPTPDHQATPVGTLSVGGGDRPGVDRVSVEAYLNGVALEGDLGFAWRMVSAPAGSQAALTAPDTASAVIQPDRPGTYDLQVTVRDRTAGTSRGPSSEQALVLTAQPDDSPFGVPIETLSSKPGGHIRIDDQPVPGTSDPSGIYYAVLDRTSRDIVQSGTVTPDFNGVFSDLNTVISEWSRRGTLGYLMVVSSASGGVDRSTIDRLNVGPLRALGYIGLNAQQESALVKRPFSFVGLIGAAPGVAWGNINSILGGSANIIGVLRVSTLTGRYDLVDPRHPTIDTRAPGTTDSTNVIRVGDTTYSAALPAGAAAGLHVLVLNPALMLEPIPFPQGDNNRVWFTNGPGGQDVNHQSTLAGRLTTLARDYPRAIFIIQSVGRVRPRVTSLGTALGSLGGNQAVFSGNAPVESGPGNYALIGRAGVEPADVTADSSSSVGQSGHLEGVLRRDRSWTFGLVAGDPAGTLNTDLLTIADQPAQPFPAFTPREQAADDYIARARPLNFCAGMSGLCDLRRQYYEHPRANWTLNYSLVRDVRFPPDQEAFSQDEFNRVQDQLKSEVAEVAQVFHYLDQVKKPFQRSHLQSYVDLVAIGKAVEDAVKAPPSVNHPWAGLGFLNKILSYGKVFLGFYPDPLFQTLLDVVSTGVMLATDLNTLAGQPAIPATFTAPTAELASRLLASYAASEQSITGAGLLIVSDYGRLTTAAGKVNGSWKPPPDETGVPRAMRYAAQAWFYQTLLPLAYRFYAINPPLPSGPATPQSLVCVYVFLEKEHLHYPLRDVPDSAQTRQIVGFDNNGVAIPQFMVIAGNYEYPPGPYRYRTSPASLTDPLFAPIDPDSTALRPPLGLNRLAFYSGRTWPKPIIIQNRFNCVRP